MARVSSKPLKRRVAQTISSEMLARFALLKGKDELAVFFEEFFTETERLMLAKRLALIVMLERGYTFEQIQKTLKVSPTTVARFWRKIKNGEFGRVLSKAKTKAGKESFTKELLLLLDSMKTRNTKHQWKNIRRMLR